MISKTHNKPKAASGDRQIGYSLVELMIGLTIGLVIIASALAIYTTTSQGARDTLGAAKLNIELRGAMGVMVEDIRRAGYGGDGFSAIAVSDTNSDDVADSLTYAYDETPTDYGFRVAEGAVEMRSGGSWEDLTDPNTVVIVPPLDGADYFEIDYQCLRANDTTSVTASSPANEPCVDSQTLYEDAEAAAVKDNTAIALIEIRMVTIRLSGHLTNDPDMTMALEQAVMVRNHRTVLIQP